MLTALLVYFVSSCLHTDQVKEKGCVPFRSIPTGKRQVLFCNFVIHILKIRALIQLVKMH